MCDNAQVYFAVSYHHLLFQSCSAKPKACVADKRRLMITLKPCKKNDKHTSYLHVCLCICERTITAVPNLDLTFTWGHASTGFTGHTHIPTLQPPLCCSLHFCKIHDTTHGGYEHAALQGHSYIRGGGRRRSPAIFTAANKDGYPWTTNAHSELARQRQNQ